MLLAVTTTQASPLAIGAARGGRLDLATASAPTTIVALDGEWACYWGILPNATATNLGLPASPTGFLALPGVWNDRSLPGIGPLPGTGAVTLRLHIHRPADAPIQALAFGQVNCAWRAWVNGRPVGHCGEPGLDEAHTRPHWQHVVVPLPAEVGTDIDLVIGVANFHTKFGGLVRSPHLGPLTAIAADRERGVAFDAFMAGGLLMMGLYHFGLFHHRRKDRASLFFGLICLLVGGRALLTGEMLVAQWLPQLPFTWFARLSFLSLVLTVPMFVMFIAELYPEETPRRAPHLFNLVGVLTTAIVLTTPVWVFSHLQQPYHVVTLGGALLMGRVLVRAWQRGHAGSGPWLVGYAALVTTVINDILVFNGVLATGYCAPLGLLILVVFQGFTLSLRYSLAFATIEAFTDNLQRLNMAYERFVPKQLLRFLDKKSITDVNLGDQVERDMTVMFVDIRSFTQMSEAMTPKENFDFINSYLRRVGPIVREHHGFIDKYIGDEIMALFPGAVEDAVQAAIAIQREILVYNQHRQSRGYRPIAIGIGIHTGPLMLGTVGEEQRMEGTVIADSVNLASRLQRLTKYYGVGIAFSEKTFCQIDATRHQFRFLAKVLVKGKSEAVSVFELIVSPADKPDQAMKCQTRNRFEEGLTLYYGRKFAAAVQAFTDVLNTDPDDRAAALFRDRAMDCQRNGVAPDWTGVEPLTDQG